MKKFINFCKKPLLITSLVVFGLFFAMLIVLWSIPHSNVYSFKKSMGIFGKMEIEMKFKNNKLEMRANMDSLKDYVDFEAPETEVVFYDIYRGKLYVFENNENVEVGKINAFTIKMDTMKTINGSKDEFYEAAKNEGYSTEQINEMWQQEIVGARFMFGNEIVFKCALTIALRTTAIVFISVFGAIGAICLIIFILDKKGVIKYKEEVNPDILVEVETVSSSLSSEESVVPVEGNALEPAIKKTRVSSKKSSTKSASNKVKQKNIK